MYYMYVLRSKLNGELYTGSTNNLKIRVEQHNNGKEISTRRYIPWELIYYEAYKQEIFARMREKRLKHHGNAIRELKKRIGLIKSGAGFTLIELLIVIAIIGILAGIVVTNFSSAQKKARDAQRKSDLRQIQSALEIYRSDIGSYPSASSLANCPTSGTKTSLGNIDCTVTYMKTIPSDPKGSGYYNGGVYLYNNSGGTTYNISTCLEYASDSQGTPTVPSPAGSGTCSSNLYFTVNNP